MVKEIDDAKKHGKETEGQIAAMVNYLKKADTSLQKAMKQESDHEAVKAMVHEMIRTHLRKVKRTERRETKPEHHLEEDLKEIAKYVDGKDKQIIEEAIKELHIFQAWIIERFSFWAGHQEKDLKNIENEEGIAAALAKKGKDISAMEKDLHEKLQKEELDMRRLIKKLTGAIAVIEEKVLPEMKKLEHDLGVAA